MGSHHIPHSGDIPNTLMHTSASSVMFTPFNFHDSDPTRRSAQGVRIDNGDDGKKSRYYGGRYREGVALKAVSEYFHRHSSALHSQGIPCHHLPEDW